MSKFGLFTLVSSSSGDWIGLYHDGKLITEGHSLSGREVLGLLGFKVEEKEAQEDWLEERGNLPQLLKDVKF
jgi:hypothetical protein